jgi:hypothetical protein
MAKANDVAGAPSAKEDLVEVRLVRGYVPLDGTYDERESLQGDRVLVSKIYHKRMPGEVLALPRVEARDILRKGIAVIDGDLV